MVCAIVDSLLYVGIATSKSASPTLINWRSRSSESRLSSAKKSPLLLYIATFRETLEIYTRYVASSKFKCGANETKRIDRAQASVNRAVLRCAETSSCQTFR